MLRIPRRLADLESSIRDIQDDKDTLRTAKTLQDSQGI
jgi:hypothetical protein